MVKHVLVTLTDEQYRCLNYLKGKMGNSDAEVLRNIFLAWLSEKTEMGCWSTPENSEKGTTSR